MSEFVNSSFFVAVIVCMSCKGSYVFYIGVCVIAEVFKAEIMLDYLSCKFEIDPRIYGYS